MTTKKDIQPYKPKVTVNKKNGIFVLNQDRSDLHDSERFEFGSVKQRDLLDHIDPKARYSFFSTIANPEAVQALWSVHKRVMDANDRSFHFNNGLMNTYLESLAVVATQHKIPDYKYDLVEHQHSGGWPHMDSPNWPHIHIVPEKKKSEFANIVNKLHNEEGYKAISKYEGPQNYRMPQVDFLRKRNIAPLALKHEKSIDGKTLCDVINLLCGFDYSAHTPSHSDD